ncbi:MAG: hypothetical protein CMF69_00575 [Magnetovibrio sp.]|nr:hypothetical protein [Magnetovibrio sp.]
MFSYTIKVNRLPRPLGKIVGFASILIDDVLEVNGFRIINGAKGLFVSPPQHKGKGKDEAGNEIEKWYDDVRFVGDTSEDVSKEIKESILTSYNEATGAASRTTAAQSQVQVNASNQSQPSAQNNTQVNSARKPLW